MDGIYYDGAGLDLLAADLESAALAIPAAADETLTNVGNDVGATAASIAASNGSTSIPGTVRGQLSGHEYRLQVGDSAIAGLWEYGNRSGGSENSFVHPVFGSTAMVSQARYPFLKPALRQSEGSILAHMEAMWNLALDPFHLGPEA